MALLSGGRVKIGYQAGLKLLRAGAHLIVTTRFPRDAASRYAAEPDFGDWGHRLEVFGLDLRHTPSVEAFCHELLTTRDRLDFIINNACQTVRRPPDFYAHMMAEETAALHDMPEHVRKLVGAYEGLPRLSHAARGGRGRIGARPLLERQAVRGLGADARRRAVAGAAAVGRAARAAGAVPGGRLDQDLQQIDLRDRNSWRMMLADVPTVELLEVHLVNAVAPFVLNARLKPLMLRTPNRDKHIVNVSAVEGQFYRNFKTTKHPHTNMAKAALNMMTRTSAADYHADGIHMNSVDTGWVTDEDPVEIAARKQCGTPLPPAARHRRRRRPHRRSHHLGREHRHARLGEVSEGLPADGLVDEVSSSGTRNQNSEPGTSSRTRKSELGSPGTWTHLVLRWRRLHHGRQPPASSAR